MTARTAHSTSRHHAERPDAGGVTDWRDRLLHDLLDENGLAGAREASFPTDGWSGATFTTMARSDRRFVLKRVSATKDWIVRATGDDLLREAWVAFEGASRRTYLGAAADPDGGAAILMPDLSGELMTWGDQPRSTGLDAADIDHLIERIVAFHATPWSDGIDVPWCPLAERLTLLSPAAADRYVAEANPVGAIFRDGWADFGRSAPFAARDLIERLSTDVGPLIAAMGRLPDVELHGDLKFANVARFRDGTIGFIDWQMTLRAPVAVELGWLLVSNSAELPVPPDDVLRRYRAAWQRQAAPEAGRPFIEDVIGDWERQVDLAMIVGLLLRGWRKSLDTVAGVTLGSGIAAADDLAWWSERAVEAADRRL
jgi:hypothetical protein